MSINELNIKLLTLKTKATLNWFKAKKEKDINKMQLWDEVITIIDNKLIL